MAGRATLTMVPSRNATPEPSTVARSTHRASLVPMRTSQGYDARADTGRDGRLAPTAARRYSDAASVVGPVELPTRVRAPMGSPLPTVPTRLARAVRPTARR